MEVSLLKRERNRAGGRGLPCGVAYGISVTLAVSLDVAPVESVTVNRNVYVPGPPRNVTFGVALLPPLICTAGVLAVAVHL